MSEFLRLIPDEKLFDLAAEAEARHLEDAERLIRAEINKRLARTALSYGVYDASQDEYETRERSWDDQWIVRGQE